MGLPHQIVDFPRTSSVSLIYWMHQARQGSREARIGDAVGEEDFGVAIAALNVGYAVSGRSKVVPMSRIGFVGRPVVLGDDPVVVRGVGAFGIRRVFADGRQVQAVGRSV